LHNLKTAGITNATKQSVAATTIPHCQTRFGLLHRKPFANGVAIITNLHLRCLLFVNGELMFFTVNHGETTDCIIYLNCVSVIYNV